jgi:hypothetical protein
MKKLKSLLGVAAIGLATLTSAQAQTNLLSGDLGRVGTDLWNDIETIAPFTTNGQATVAMGYGMNTASKNQIEVLLLTVPVSQNVAIGAVGGHMGSTWYEGGASVSYGITNTIPILGKIRSYAGDGVVYNLKANEPANYAFAGMQKTWDISSKFDAGMGYIVGNTSDRPGMDILIGGHLTFKW